MSTYLPGVTRLEETGTAIEDWLEVSKLLIYVKIAAHTNGYLSHPV
jgi:hypothetical protein